MKQPSLDPSPVPLPRKPRPTLAGVWAAVAFILLTIPTLLLILLIPGKLNRSALARKVARIFLKLAGVDLRVEHLERLPEGACVVVANHASYLDGVIVKAALPPRFSFVIKKEILKVPLVGLFLKRVGSEFVDRFNRHSGAVDTRRLMRGAGQGQSLGFFPEGTIPAEIGIGQFHPGAFVIAARAGLPVVPVAIRGTRLALPLGNIWLKPGKVTVCLLPPIHPEEKKSSETAAVLRETARQSILSTVGEPDLAVLVQLDSAPQRYAAS